VVKPKTGGTVEVHSASESEDENEGITTPTSADDVVMTDPPAEDDQPPATTGERMEDVQTEAPATAERTAAVPAPPTADPAAEDATSSDSDVSETTSRTTGRSTTPTESGEAEPARPDGPVPHVFYFVQQFNVEKQEFRLLGSFLAPHELNIKAAIREKLEWPAERDFSVWARADGTSVAPVFDYSTFTSRLADGVCFIVGDKLTKKE
jgi:hypothetical protein